MDLKEVIASCCKNDAKAQKALYKHYAPQMFMHVYRYVKNKEDSEEVLMDGFLKVFTYLGKVKNISINDFDAWIKKVLVNEGLMLLRKRNILEYRPEKDLPQQLTIDFPAESKLRAEDLYKLVLELPVGYRTVFNMYAIEGYSHKEISEILKIGESTSRSQLTKARIMLKELVLKNESQDERAGV